MTGRNSEESKKNFSLMRDRILDQQGKKYWRSLDEFVDTPEFEEFVHQEFPQHAETWSDSVSRRSFIKIMGASLALAGLSSACVIQPQEKAIPYVKLPEEVVPGKSLFYATAMTLGGTAVGLLARSNEGRPTKIEGNPEHPGSLGSTDRYAQASLLTMYDPDRAQNFYYRNDPRSYDKFVTEIRAIAEDNRKNGGAGIRFLTETTTSPTLNAQFQQILGEMPNARWYQYEPINSDNKTNGAKMAFGENVNTVYKFEEAERVLSLDSDFLADFNVRYIRDFSDARRVSTSKKEMNRLYVVEHTPTITGAKADHRLGIKPSQMEGFAKAVAKALGVAGANSNYTENANWIAAMAKDLQAYRGRSIVVAGDNQSPIIHALAHSMNAALGNVGKTVVYTEPIEANVSGANAKTQTEGLRELAKDIDAGAIQLLVILGGNPTYNAPADLKFDLERLKKVPVRVHLSLFKNETSEVCQWNLPQTHFLEEFSDARAFDGTATMIQPLIAPLYGGKSIHEVLNVFAKENYDRPGYEIVKEYWQKQGLGGTLKPFGATTSANVAQTATAANNSTAASATPAPNASPTPAKVNNADAFDRAWRKAVHDGFIANTTAPTKNVTPKADFLGQTANLQASNGSNVEVMILPDPSVFDGRFSNNGWLQELPKPLNKVTWDNVLLISPNTAKRLNLNQENKYNPQTGAEEGTAFVTTKGGNLFANLVTVKMDGNQMSKPAPIWVMPGQPDDVITMYMGYGRTQAGRVGSGIGYSAFDVRSSNTMDFGIAELTATGEKYDLASTQTHFNMEGRDIIRTREFEKYAEESPAKHNEDEEIYDKSMFPRYEYNKYHKWGMSIDLNSCVGCNACVVACQSENNSPVVGKEQVQRSREMQWMRIDTYFEGENLDNPDGTHFQPLLCQQCEQAPCETVCPVHATVHDAEGLNAMVYNRCVGTRYCSNNCPYKVRRFNFLLYQDWNTPQYKMMRNPEVSIRSRGVMEKCTYCMQRIALARIEAQKDGGRNVRDGEVQTACQTVCPTEAIIFGDMNDPNSAVNKVKAEQRNYALLNEELNTQPRTTYLAGLKNPNKEMPDYKPEPKKAEHGEDVEHKENAEDKEHKE